MPSTPIKQQPPPPPRKFALLADATLRLLADPTLDMVPEYFSEALVAARIVPNWSNSTRRRLFSASFAAARNQLQQAQKFTLDDDFMRLVNEAAEEDPNWLLQLLNTARPPFVPCWLEWNTTRPLFASTPPDLTARWGVLLTKRADTDDDDQFEAVLVINPDPRIIRTSAIIIPGVMMISFRDIVANVIKFIYLHSQTETFAEFLFGREWCARWGIGGPPITTRLDFWNQLSDIAPDDPRWLWDRAYRMSAVELFQHGACVWGPGPFGDLFRQIGTGEDIKSERAHIFLATVTHVFSGLFRELVAILALLATHLDDNALVTYTTTTIKPSFYGGKFHPAIEYKVVQLARPMTVSQIRHHVARKPRPDLRWHQVMGHWRYYQSAANAHCAKHPRSCPRVAWRRIEPKAEPGDDGLVEPDHDRQECSLCARRRTWVRDHARGDVREGMLEKDYKITANRRDSSSSRSA